MPAVKALAVAATVAAVGTIAAGQAVRAFDELRAQRAWRELDEPPGSAPLRFDPAVLEGLPEPARRYFHFTITSGALLSTTARLEMTGDFSLGTRQKPNYIRMQAREILSAPRGFVWQASLGAAPAEFSGSDGLLDGAAWTRFWLDSVAPVARMAGDDDLGRSAEARLYAEALFWTPAALLPRKGVAWTRINDETVRVSINGRKGTVSIDLTVARDGRPISFVMMRWSNANPERRFKWQPFGGTFGATGQFSGYRVPVAVEIGNQYGGPDYFPFFRATVSDIQYL